MKAAVDHVQSQGATLRESARLYNVPLEMLRRRVNGTVAIDCRPGPNTVLTEEEEIKLADYLLQMSEICLLYTSPSPRDATLSRMPSSA